MDLSSMGNFGQLVSMLLLYGVVIGGMYLFLFRPQQKRRKEEEEMRKSLEIGDEVVTIGGIIGRVISIKEDSDTLVLESGSDKIKIKRWAIASNSSANKSTNENAK